MDGTFFCPRCGLGGIPPQRAWAECDRCGLGFAVPPGLVSASWASSATPPGQALPSGPPRTVGYDIATATLLYLFAPVGLAFLWSHPTWPHRRKVMLTTVVVGGWGLLLLASIGMAVVYAAVQ